MKKLRICHVSLTVYPDRRDGSAKYQRSLFDELKSRGHEIKLVTAKWENGFKDEDIIPIDVPNSRFLWAPKFCLKARKYLKNNEFDIIQGNGSRGSLPIMFTKKRYLTHIHDVGTFQASFTKIPGLKYMEKKNAQKAEHIMCCAESARHEISEHMGVSAEKITSVSSAIDPNYKPMPERAEKLKEELGLEGPIIYYVGRIAFYKGVDDIIKAYYIAKKEIPDLNLVIGGIPTLKMKPEVEKWKNQYADVHFAGMIPDELMPVYYTMADAFVTYSYASEGFGLTPVESLACKTPVICSTLPAYKEVLQQYATFVVPQRPDLLSEAILNNLNNPGRVDDKVNEAQEFIKRYTWPEVADRVEKVYRDFLE